jgi:hypothetical protein
VNGDSARRFGVDVLAVIALLLLVVAAGLYLLGAVHVLDRLYGADDPDRVIYVALEIAPIAVLWIAAGALGLWPRARLLAAGIAIGLAVYVGVGSVGGILLDDGVNGMHGPEIGGSLAAICASVLLLVAARRDRRAEDGSASARL